ncbi:MAG: SLC13 family permease [Clostridiaceae bacterium]|nr:SLC13 family permease [Clostridiaceae bacterium]
MDKKVCSLLAGILIAILLFLVPIPSLTKEGRLFISLTIMTVIFWVFQVAQSGFVAGLYLSLLIIFKVAPEGVILYAWTGSTMYLVIGAYLIAGAVKTSGLGERIAYNFIIRFVSSYNSIIISSFALTALLSLFIPLPWPRAFLVMSVMSIIVEIAGLSEASAIKVGFSVFAASVPTSLIFLTGDSLLNPLAIKLSGISVSWIQWFVYMGIPAIIASGLTYLAFIFTFKEEENVSIDKMEIKRKLQDLGALTSMEKYTMFWLLLAIFLWTTDFLHGIDLGWATFTVSMLMGLPLLTGILSPDAWREIPIGILIFLTAAMAIGNVGAYTGVNQWIAQTLLPSSMPSNMFLIGAFIVGVSIIIHLLLGSVIAVIGVAIPAILSFTEPLGINSLIPTFLVYTAVAIHYILPFHHLNILLGEGVTNGRYSRKESLKLAVPLTIIVFVITLLVELPWWKLLGLY